MLIKPPSIFYGWWNVLAGFVGMGLSYAMFTIFVFGTLVEPLQSEFGWSRVQLSYALSLTNIAIVIASPFIGFVIDKIGVRHTVIPSLILMGGSVASMVFLSGNIWYFYALFFLIPFLGAGTLPQSYSRVLIAWFARRRGIALGISLSGFGVGAALIPYISQLVIDNYGWRAAYLCFTCAIFFISLPVMFLLLRESPKDMGLYPDGTINGIEQNSSLASISDPKAGLVTTRAIKTKNFWLLLSSFLLVGIGITSVVAHLVPMLTDRGIEPHVAASSMTALGIGLILGRIIAGYLMDIFFAPYVTAGFILGLFVAILILATGTNSQLVFVAAVLVGLATGSEISEIAYMCSRYFGQKAFALIYGLMFAAFQLGSSIGAPLLGSYFDAHGNYIEALQIVAAIVFVAIILILNLGPYPTNSEFTQNDQFRSK